MSTTSGRDSSPPPSCLASRLPAYQLDASVDELVDLPLSGEGHLILSGESTSDKEERQQHPDEHDTGPDEHGRVERGRWRDRYKGGSGWTRSFSARWRPAKPDGGPDDEQDHEQC